MDKYVLVFDSPNLNPESVRVARSKEGELSLREALEERDRLIEDQLGEWLEAGGESAYWRVGPSGNHYGPRAWVEAYGFEMYPVEHSHYYYIRRKIAPKQRIYRAFDREMIVKDFAGADAYIRYQDNFPQPARKKHVEIIVLGEKYGGSDYYLMTIRVDRHQTGMTEVVRIA